MLKRVEICGHFDDFNVITKTSRSDAREKETFYQFERKKQNLRGQFGGFVLPSDRLLFILLLLLLLLLLLVFFQEIDPAEFEVWFSSEKKLRHILIIDSIQLLPIKSEINVHAFSIITQ